MLQLSEECGELIQALLKYIRATKGLTPISERECKENILEEVSDVLLNIDQLLYLDKDLFRKVPEIKEFKTKRWYNRLFPKKYETKVGVIK